MTRAMPFCIIPSCGKSAERNPEMSYTTESPAKLGKTSLICSIISVAITAIPFIGAAAGLPLGIIGFIRGNNAVARANATGDKTGIGMSITGKWMGLGGIIQNAIALLWFTLALLCAL